MRTYTPKDIRAHIVFCTVKSIIGKYQAIKLQYILTALVFCI